MKMPILRDRRGQSIIEVLVATAVGAIMIIAAVGLLSPALRGNRDVSKVQISSALAKEMIDQVRVLQKPTGTTSLDWPPPPPTPITS